MPWELIKKNLIQLPEDAKFNFSKIKELVLKYKAEIFFDQGKQYILRIKPDRKHQDIGLELHLLGFQYDVYTESFNYSWEKHENVAELNELIAFFNAEKTEEEIKFYLSKKIHLFIKELNYGHPGVIFLFLKACKIGIIKLQNYDLDWYKSLVKAVQNRSISAALELELDENIDVGIRYFFKLARIKLEEKYNKEEDTLGCHLCVKLN